LRELDLTALLEEGSDPPGPMPMYLPPSNPAVWMLASLSSGISAYCFSIRRVTFALNVLGSNLMDSTRPMRTPAMVTGDPSFRSPMLSKAATTE
jgi:hypothetical protein